MHYAPTQDELLSLLNATASERLNYFLTRAMEAEEVWSLSNGLGWAITELDGLSLLAIWPYSELAHAYTQATQDSNTPDAVSLEHFVYNLLPMMDERDIHIEVMPTSTQKGVVLEAKALFEIIERKLDTGEYFLEG